MGYSYSTSNTSGFLYYASEVLIYIWMMVRPPHNQEPYYNENHTLI